MQAGLGSQAAQIPVGLGSQMGGFRYQAGRDIADQISGVNAGIAGLTEQQGRGLSDIVGNATNNVQNLLQGAYGGDQQSRQQLMTLLSNLASQQGSQIAGQPIIPGFQSNYVGQLGQIASGIGGMAYGLGATGMNADPVVTGSGSGFNTVPGYGPSYAGSYNPMFSLGMG